MNIKLPKKMINGLALFGCVSVILTSGHLWATEVGETEKAEKTEETLEQLQSQLEKIELKIAQNAELELEKKATIAEIEQAFKDKSLEIQSKDEQIAMLEQQLKELSQEDTQ